MNPALVNEAVQLAIAAETPGPHDMTLFLHNSFGKEPFNTIVGPVKDRGGAAASSRATATSSPSGAIRSAPTSPTASRRRS